MVDDDWAEIQRDFQIQTDRQVMANQPDIVVVGKVEKEAVATCGSPQKQRQDLNRC